MNRLYLSPFPWRFIKADRRAAVQDRDGNSIASLIELAPSLHLDANGRLMAAAPEVMEALRQLADYVVALGEESAWKNIREKTRQQRIIVLSIADEALAKTEEK